MVILDVLVILDRTGSMEEGRADHEGGLRSFVRDQKTLDGDVRLTLTQFDSANPCEVVFNRVPIQDVDESTIVLIPRGGTPLFAGIGLALAHLEKLQQDEPADQTIVMVITDGEDTGGNGEWTKPLVEKRAKSMEKKGASFLYLAADMDAFEEAGKAGLGGTVPQTLSAGYSPNTTGSVSAMYGTLSNKVAAVRMARGRGMSGASASAALNFTAADYDNINVGSSVTFDGGVAAFADAVKAANVKVDKKDKE